MKVNVSAHIDEKLAHKLEKVAEFEGRSKTYYIKKGLEIVLAANSQDMEDMLSARKTLKAARVNNDFVSFDEVFKNID